VNSDGVCDELEIAGCTDITSCNYDPLATLNDGSCTHPDQYKDCSGNCLNDADGDGTCDENEEEVASVPIKSELVVLISVAGIGTIAGLAMYFVRDCTSDRANRFIYNPV